MARERQAKVAILGDASSLIRAFRQASGATERFGKTSKLGAAGIGLIAGGAAAAGVALQQGLMTALSTGISEFEEAAKVSAQTAAAIKSTGGAAGVTQTHIEDLASALQSQTGLQDDAIQSAQNLLLTFTDISNKGPDKIFDRTTRAAMDLSVAFHKDLNSSAIMVGKALNDPEKGLTALGKAGVQFTKAQKETIKSLVETGQKAKAQKMILSELEKQVGGSAKAYGNTMPGQIEKAKRAFEDMTQGIVSAAAPLAATVLPYLTLAIRSTTTFFQQNWPKIKQTAQEGWAYFQTNLLPQFQSLSESIRVTVVQIVGFFRTYWPQIWSTVGPAMTNIINNTRSMLSVLSGVFKVFGALLKGDWSGVFTALRGLVTTFFVGLFNQFRGMVTQAFNIAKLVGLALWNGMKNGVSQMASLAGWVLGKITQGIGSLVNGLFNHMRAAGEAAWNGIKAGAAAVAGLPTWILGKIVGAVAHMVAAVLHAFVGIGTAIVSGIKAGISSAWDGFLGWLGDMLGGGLLGWAKDKLGIGSPSRVFADQVGGPIVDGIRVGMERKAGGPRAAIIKIVNGAMRDAVASAKAKAQSLAGTFGPLLAQALTSGDASRLAGLQSGLAADQSARQKADLESAVTTAKAEEDNAQAAISTAEDRIQAQADLAAATKARIDAENALSDFTRQKEIDDLSASIESRKAKYQEDIDNMAAQFARGTISAQQFRASLDALVGGEQGASLGEAFAANFMTALDQLRNQISEIGKVAGEGGVSTTGEKSEAPIDVWNKAVAKRKKTLIAQWNKDHPKGNPKDRTEWVNDRLDAWRTSNAGAFGIALAAGGITTGPTNALIGEAGREAVIPLDGARARKMLSRVGVGSPTVNLTFNGVLDAKDAARMLRPELDRLVRLAV